MRKDAQHRGKVCLIKALDGSWLIRGVLVALSFSLSVLLASPGVNATVAEVTSGSVTAVRADDRYKPDPDEGTTGGELSDASLDPFGFDIELTTETEVAWMRFDVMFDVLTAKVQVEMAALRVDQSREEHSQAVDDLERAVQELAAIDSALSGAAIDGFMHDRLETTGASVVAPSLEAIAGNSTSGFTTEFLLAERERATETKAAAEEAEHDAQQTLSAAEAVLSTSTVELDDRREDVDAFEVRAGEHQVAMERADAVADAMSDELDLSSVAGSIVLNTAIERDVDGLIADARSDGIDLGGHGFRTYEQQVALRLINCGGGPVAEPGTGRLSAEDGSASGPLVDPDSDPSQPSAAEQQARYHYVVFEMPASSCSPPTAKPGTSEHESGLAIDFTENGSILTSASPAFVWMKEHAEDYGLLNLPGEPWHWSTTGH